MDSFFFRALEADAPQIVSIALCAGLRAPHAGQHVLLHDDPASVMVRTEPVNNSGKRDRALAKLAKEAVTHRHEVVPALAARSRGDLWLAVFEMHMPDALGETLKRFHDHLTIVLPGAKKHMAGIEDQAEQSCVGQCEQTSRLFWRLDIPGAVMMESRPQSSLLAHDPRNAFSPAREGFPFLCIQAQGRRNAPGLGRANRIGAIVIRQDEQGPLLARRSARLGQQASYTNGSGLPARVRIGMPERHRYERSHHCHLATLKFTPKHARVGRHISPVSKFAADIARLTQLIKHLPERDCLPLQAFKFERSPRTGGVCDTD